MRSPRPPRSSRSKSRSLALLSDDRPLPLTTLPPHPRRSPRLTTAGSPSLTPPHPLHALRTSSPRSPVAGTSWSRPNPRKTMTPVSEKCLTRSPRLGEGNSAASSDIASGALRDPSSKPASKNPARLLRISSTELRPRRSPRLSMSPDMDAPTVHEPAASSKDRRCVDKWSILKDHEKKTKSLQLSEAKSLRRSSRLSPCQSTIASSCSSPASPRISHANLKFSQSDRNIPFSRDAYTLQTKSSRTLDEKACPLKWNKDDKIMPMQSMLHDPTYIDPLLRRSPRFTLAPDNSIGNSSKRKLDIRTGQVEQQKRSLRYSPLGVHTNIDLNGEIVDGSNTRPSKKVKVPPLNSCTIILDDEKTVSLSSEGNTILVKAQKNKNGLMSTLVLEKTEQNPSVTKTSDSLGSRGTINFFIGDPICEEEARERWQWRYEMKNQVTRVKSKSSDSDNEDEIVTDVKCHYRQAQVNGCIYSLGDCARIRGEGGKEHVGRILEFFRTTYGKDYFRVQWFYRADDTVLQEQAAFHDKKRLFYSNVENDNPVDCIISKVKITRINPKFGVKSNSTPPSDFYYDMEYCLEYSSFCNLPSGDTSIQKVLDSAPSLVERNKPSSSTDKAELTLLDLFSGCGGMSTGLCLGAKLSSINLVLKWSLDCDESACESLKLNHPETLVRNDAAEDFLQLLKEWEKLCKRYAANKTKGTCTVRSKDSEVDHSNEHLINDIEVPKGEYEVGSLVDICYGDPSETGKRGLKFKVRWKGYSSADDTWEPVEALSKCQERIVDFVRAGYGSKILPLPGDVDVICGGPPCQGISGYNRYRNIDSPLDDERNRQIIVFMDIVQFLKPKFVLMENVTDILRFDNASLGRYALSRLVHMRYQARLGTIAAGAYGLPQFRLRVFLWGAHPEEMLPQFPLPTHDVIVRYWPPLEFERNTVAYSEDRPHELEKAAVLRDAISDLPEVTNHETREQISYDKSPETELQRFIRSSKYELTGCQIDKWAQTKSLLYDHRPRVYSEDSYLRICQVPKRKGANFRDFPGIVVGNDNVVRRDVTKEPMLLPSGKPMVPDFVLTFEQGRSKRPYGRLWWDETIPTVLASPSCRNQVTLHPEQDRVLTIRECARLQGFPDYYRFCGTIKERYCQIGNAVAVPVARALGYSLGMAYRKLSGNEPNMILPPKFSYSTFTQFTNSQSPAEA